MAVAFLVLLFLAVVPFTFRFVFVFRLTLLEGVFPLEVLVAEVFLLTFPRLFAVLVSALFLLTFPLLEALFPEFERALVLPELLDTYVFLRFGL